MAIPVPLTIPEPAKQRLKVMLLAKHARSGGAAHAADGNHAVYHHELRSTLEDIGLDVVAADSFEAVEQRPEVDFVIPLLNRAGFTHSEMLAPLQLTRHGLPFLGAAPIVRGLTDDKHLTKLVARAHNVPTADWMLYRQGGATPAPPPFADDLLIVKPSASSASWGIARFDEWADARDHIGWLHDHGHDAIVERWTPLIDVAVPVIGGRGNKPWVLPAMACRPADPYALRSYEEKRGLVETDELDPLEPVTDPDLIARLEAAVQPLLTEFWPFDYGRFEFRYDPADGAVSFMEVNLSCNLWSRKTISRSARALNLSHRQVVESIVAHSMGRQRLIPTAREHPVY